jgi:hypothetical protein
VRNANKILLEREDWDMLGNLAEVPSFAFTRPKEVKLDDIKRENQGSIGSCQGNSITSCLERLANVEGTHYADYKGGVQLSRIYAYLASQKLDGLLGGDNGSTISSGVKVALRSVPTEANVPYPSPARYPGKARRDEILSWWDRTTPFKAKSTWRVSSDVDAVMDFIGGGGAINMAILWYRGIIPRDRVVRSYRPPGRTGGHAVAILGYTEDGLLRFMNSHGDGEFRVTPKAFKQMMAHRWTAAIGIKGSEKPDPVDWIEESPLW